MKTMRQTLSLCAVVLGLVGCCGGPPVRAVNPARIGRSCRGSVDPHRREIALHVTRPIRWDSDHVVLFDDETREMAKEIVRCGGLDGSVKLALDYFDASINRISAWVVGFRNFQKALYMHC